MPFTPIIKVATTYPITSWLIVGLLASKLKGNFAMAAYFRNFSDFEDERTAEMEKIN